MRKNRIHTPMKNHRSLPTVFVILAAWGALVTVRAADKVKVIPPEVTALAGQLVKALQTGDEAAMLACWHPAETVIKLKEADARTYSNPPKREMKRFLGQEAGRQKDREADNKARFAQMRKLIAQFFGDPAKLELVRIDLDPDDQPNPTFEDVEILMKTEKGAIIEYEIEAAVQVGGVWKFAGRGDDEFSIELGR